MRILMLTDFYPPFTGGVEQHVHTLSRDLVRIGHEVAVATQWREGLPRFEIAEGVRIHRFTGTLSRLGRAYKDSRRRWTPPFPDPEVTWSLARIIQDERPDIVHAHTWIVHSFLPLKRRSGARLVVSLHNYGYTCIRTDLLYHNRSICDGPGFAKCLGCSADHFGLARGVPSFLAYAPTRALLRAATDLFLPVSLAVAEGSGLTGMECPYEVIPNFLPDASSESDEPHDALGAALPEGEFILFVGALRPLKGIDSLLDAYAGLRDGPPLVLIGGTFHDTPARFPAGVTVLKDWPHGAVMGAFRRCLFSVVPSVWPEPFGIVVIEAMAAGRPVIAARIGGLTDLVSDGETGLLVPHGNTGALRDAMTRLLENPALRQAMGQAARQKALAFQAAAVVPRVVAAYTRLIDHSRPVTTHGPGAAQQERS